MAGPRPWVDPRNLARVRTQVWFASMALQAMQAEVTKEMAIEAEEKLGPIRRLLELAEIKLSDVIDLGTRVKSDAP